MTDHEGLPENFIQQVKEALEKLYDFYALQKHSLAHRFSAQLSDPNTSSAHYLRGQLLEAIETLNPGQHVAVHSGTARIYNLLHLHYVGKLTMQQAAWEVGVSLRQAYRDLRRGQELVSAVLWHKLHTEAASPPQTASAHAQIMRLCDSTTMIDMQTLLDSAVRPVRVLADKYNVALAVDAPASPVMIPANLTLAQQILTHLLSQVIQQFCPPSLRIQLMQGDPFLRLRCAGTAQPTLHLRPIIQQMLEQIHWELQYTLTNGLQEICLMSSRRRAFIAMIDDDGGLSHMLQRCLMEDAYTVISVPGTDEGLRILQQMQPQALILDVMMRGTNGWEMLQRLRTSEETRAIPVIICSALHDPELAFALGASSCVARPVSRDSLRLALQQIRA